MIRIVCPFCHSPLAATDLETAILADRVCLVCPECAQVLLMDEDVPPVHTEAAAAHA